MQFYCIICGCWIRFGVKTRIWAEQSKNPKRITDIHGPLALVFRPLPQFMIHKRRINVAIFVNAVQWHHTPGEVRALVRTARRFRLQTRTRLVVDNRIGGHRVGILGECLLAIDFEDICFFVFCQQNREKTPGIILFVLKKWAGKNRNIISKVKNHGIPISSPSPPNSIFFSSVKELSCM